MTYRFNRRTVIGLLGASAAGLSGCAGLLESQSDDDSGTEGSKLVDPPVDSPPFDDKLRIQLGDLEAKMSNPWVYKERFTDGASIEGFERPLWICVFPDNADVESSPGENQPHRNFEITDGSVKPQVGTEPTNDVYIALKRHTDQATLKFLAHQAGAYSKLFFEDTLVLDTETVEPGTTVTLPPQ
jgi:hypothetical protein